MREIRFKNSHDASMYNKGYEQGRADSRNHVLSTLKKLIDSDYKSKDCQLLFSDLCEMLLEDIKEQKNE